MSAPHRSEVQIWCYACSHRRLGLSTELLISHRDILQYLESWLWCLSKVKNRAVRFDCLTHGGSIRVSRHCPALTDSVSARKLGIASFSFQVGRSKQGRRTTIATHCAKKSHKLCLYFGTQYGCCQDLVELIEFNVVIVHPRPAISSLPTTNQTFISAIRSSKVTLA